MKIFSVLALIGLATIMTACGEAARDVFPGYAEGEYVRLASPIAGALTSLHVQRGDRIARNAPVFALEQDSERAGREEARSRVERAQALLANLQKGKRPDEIAAVQAQIGQARAALQLSSAELARQQKLVAARFTSPARLDEARAALERDQARLRELQAQLRVAQLGARRDEIDAASQDLKAAQAQLAQAEWRLEQKTQRTPVAAQVIDVLYREGEWVPAGSPVLSLLPPQNIKARFFVPEAMLGQVRLGQQVSLRCDGCGPAIDARVSYISPTAEYTAPLIYSKENRAALVFMIEARPAADAAPRLHPGQPLEVRIAAGAGSTP